MRPLSDLPRVVQRIGVVPGVWLVGGAAAYAMGADVPTKDWDFIVEPLAHSAALAHLREPPVACDPPVQRLGMDPEARATFPREVRAAREVVQHIDSQGVEKTTHEGLGLRRGPRRQAEGEQTMQARPERSGDGPGRLHEATWRRSRPVGYPVGASTRQPLRGESSTSRSAPSKFTSSRCALSKIAPRRSHR